MNLESFFRRTLSKVDKRLTESELGESLKKAASLVKVGSIYKHYKGNQYKVTGLAIYEPNSEPCVIYKALYGDNLTFIRPVSVWTETINIDGIEVCRFSLV
jgi:hypothetical protein